MLLLLLSEVVKVGEGRKEEEEEAWQGLLGMISLPPSNFLYSFSYSHSKEKNKEKRIWPGALGRPRGIGWRGRWEW